ncbi:MAG: hypothetical protein LBG06_12050 [Deltaproteobacteria bacterium]|nr:hypothetical protein [Deltaproteobacteria bacterium]
MAEGKAGGITEERAKAFPRLPAQGVGPGIVAMSFGRAVVEALRKGDPV